MKAIDSPFTKIINGTTQFVIPVFQRDYRWTEEQCAQLWKDVLEIADTEDGGRHFLGSIVYIATGDSFAGFTRYLMIDGQQRMTTLLLLFAALRDHIRASDWEGSDTSVTAKKIDAYYLVNEQEKGEHRRKLLLRRHDDATLGSIIEGHEAPGEPSDRIVENYDFFRQQIEAVDPDQVYRGIGRLAIVDVTLDRAVDDPQLIFESLNSTGMDLSQSDLIRNFILMGLPEAEQTALYDKYWRRIEEAFRGSEGTFDAFARDYVALATRAPKQEKSSEIYRGFRRAFPKLKADGLEPALERLLRFGRYYASFSLGTGGYQDHGDLPDSLGRLRRLVDVPGILVMRLFECYDESKTLSRAEFIEALELIESYVFRRAICGLQTRGYWQVFSKIAYTIGETPLSDLKVALELQNETNRYPSDKEFKRHLETENLYGMRVTRVLLERLENHGSKETTDTSSYSIEHIMPQNPNLAPAWREMLGEDWQAIQETWLHRLGNLTLTGYNSEYRDRPFMEKKTIEGGFEDSAVRLNKFVREQDTWRSEQMEVRGIQLARKALKVWPALHVDQSLLHQAKQQKLEELAGQGDVEDVKMSKEARRLFTLLKARMDDTGDHVYEIAHNRSVSYHDPDFLMEVLPRKNYVMLLLRADFSELEDPGGIVEDASRWQWFKHAQYAGGAVVTIREDADVPAAMNVVRQALALASA